MNVRKPCSVVERWIYLAADGELSAEHEQDLEDHLDECASCRELYEQAWQGSSLLDRELGALGETMDELLHGRLAGKSIPDAPVERSPRSSIWRPRRVAALVLGALGLTAAVWVGMEMAERSTPPAAIAEVRWSGVAPRVVALGGARSEDPLPRTFGLQAGSTVETRGDTPVEVVLPSGTRVRVQPGAEFRLTEAPGGHDWHLERGDAHFAVERQAGQKFRVRTPTARIEVIGTTFDVGYDPTIEDLGPSAVRTSLVGETRITVHEGLVKVSRTDLPFEYPLGRGQVGIVTAKRVQILPPPRPTAEQPAPSSPESGAGESGAGESGAVEPGRPERPADSDVEVIPPAQPRTEKPSRGLDLPGGR